MEEQALKSLSNEKLEEAALGCMLLDRDAAELGQNSLVPEDFCTPLYRVVFTAMQAVDVVDVVTVWNELQKQGEAERVGLEWLGRIASGISTSVNLRHYIEELKRLSYLRRCVDAGREIVQAAYGQEVEKIDRTLTELQGDGYGSGAPATLEDALESYIKNLAEIRASGKSIIGQSTGFTDLDDMLGGLRDGSLNILAARPSMGKSALALDIARNAQKQLGQKERVVFFSLEMTREELAARGYTAEYLIPNDCFSVGGNDSTWQKTLQSIGENSGEIEKGMGRILINDDGGQTLEKIRSFCHGIRVSGEKIRLIVVDYLQFITTKGVDRVKEIGEVSRGLKNLAKDYGCPVLALSQLSRSCENRADRRPMLADLRESGNIEQDADVVLFLYRDAYYFPETEKQNEAELNIAKQRNGPTGPIKLRWIPNCTTFRSATRDCEEVPEEWR